MLRRYARRVAETAYATCGDLSLAYQVVGDGPIELVFASSFVSHIELMWTLPEAKAFFDRLASFCKVLLFDKAGVGLSDPVPSVRSIDDRANELDAVIAAAGFERPVIFGVSEGGPAAIVYAATRPDRVRALILTGTFPYTAFGDWDVVDRDPREIQELARVALGDDYLLTIEQIEVLLSLLRSVQSEWGSGNALRCLVPSVRSMRQLGMLERMSASPGMAKATLAAVFRIDVRPALPTITMPTLVIHATEDPIPIQMGRYLADKIPGAVLVEVDGKDHAPWFADADAIANAIEDFLTGTHGATTAAHRALRTVLFSDMVASTERASAMGDERWRSLLEQLGQATIELVERFGGSVVKNTGDGHLATFEGPTQAIRCATALHERAESLGAPLRAGIHTGECELLGDDIGGIAVHIAARIMGQAGAGETLVSSAVRDLVVGSGIGFTDRGAVALKGVPGTWQLVAVDPEGPRAGTPERALVSESTPSPADGMKRADRAVAVVAKRTPWLLRGMARLAPATSKR